MKEVILDGGEQLDGQSRLLKLNDTPDGICVTVSTPKAGVVAVLDRNQQRELVAYLAKRLWPLSRSTLGPLSKGADFRTWWERGLSRS